MAGFASDYIDVAERIRTFREKFPSGSLQAANILEPYRIETIDGSTFIIYTAAAYRTPDDPRPGVGIAWEPVPGKTNFTRDSELQNAETSAWGRAIVAALASDTKHIASSEEIRNREYVSSEKPASAADDACSKCGDPLKNGKPLKKVDGAYVHKDCKPTPDFGKSPDEGPELTQTYTAGEEPFA